MAWDSDIDLSKSKFTSRLIVERSLARGWKVRGFETNGAIFLLHIPGREKPVKVFSASPMQMSYPAAKIAKDKYITNLILADENIPVPDEMLVYLDDAVLGAAHEFIAKHGKVVVKPLDASHGKGVTTNVTSEDFQGAIDEAKANTEKSMVVVQEQLGGIDVRIVCIDYKFVDAISRIPASVIGDGEHTIRELIDLTNNSGDRGENYQTKLNVIPMNRAEQFLTSEGIERVPAKDEQVFVVGVSNIGMGGVRLNVKDLVPNFMKEMAIDAAKALDLPVCGVDFMVRQMPALDSTVEDLDLKIIEVNECPMLTMYDHLDSPEQAAVIDLYLDYIAEHE